MECCTVMHTAVFTVRIWAQITQDRWGPHVYPLFCGSSLSIATLKNKTCISETPFEACIVGIFFRPCFTNEWPKILYSLPSLPAVISKMFDLVHWIPFVTNLENNWIFLIFWLYWLIKTQPPLGSPSIMCIGLYWNVACIEAIAGNCPACINFSAFLLTHTVNFYYLF